MLCLQLLAPRAEPLLLIMRVKRSICWDDTFARKNLLQDILGEISGGETDRIFHQHHTESTGVKNNSYWYSWHQSHASPLINMKYSTAARTACLGDTAFPVDTQIVKQPETP